MSCGYDSGRVKLDAVDVRLQSHALRLSNIERRILDVTVQQAEPGERGEKGPKGDRGPVGPEGPPGPPPDHRWEGTKLRFQQSDGQWGTAVDLKGEPGITRVVGGGGPLVLPTAPPANSWFPTGW